MTNLPLQIFQVSYNFLYLLRTRSARSSWRFRNASK